MENVTGNKERLIPLIASVGATKTANSLEILSERDENRYETGVKGSGNDCLTAIFSFSSNLW